MAAVGLLGSLVTAQIVDGMTDTDLPSAYGPPRFFTHLFNGALILPVLRGARN